MAQQVSQVNYFPFDVNFHSDPKIELIEAEFGLRSLGLIQKLLCRIYNHSFYCEWSEDICMVFAKNLGVEVDKEYVQCVIEALIRRCFFDKGLYEEYGILTSKGIQKRYFNITSRRKNLPEFPAEYILIDISSYKNIGLNDLNPDSCSTNESSSPETESLSGENAYKNKQRKEEKRKEEESNEKQCVEEHTLSSACACGGTPTDEDMDDLKLFKNRCRKWREELLRSEEWRGSACRQSGLGHNFLPLIEGKMDDFEDYIISGGEQGTIGSRKDYSRRFHFWWEKYGLKKCVSVPFKGSGGGGPVMFPVKPVRHCRIGELQEMGREATEMALKILKTG